MKIDCISDLHGYLPKLPGGDLLIIAGDLTRSDELDEYLRFFYWLRKQKYVKKVLIGGNHDVLLDTGIPYPVFCELENAKCDYLLDSGTEFVYYPPLDLDKPEVFRQKLKIWGSPWTLSFKGEKPNCLAFTKPTEAELAEKFALIPDDTNILVTHSPPFEILDEVQRGDKIVSVGSKSLSTKIEHLPNLKLHVFGHIHEGYGTTQVGECEIPFVNASFVDEHYHPCHEPIGVEL